MALLRAKYDVLTKAYTGEAFSFDPRPIMPGRDLDNDIAIYLACYARASALPTGPSLIFMGRGAESLFLRRSGTRDDWLAFFAEVTRRYPALVARDSEMRERVSALATGSRAGTTPVWRPTMPEICVGSALLELAQAGTKIVGDAALPGGRGEKGHVRRCDYHVVAGGAELRIEVLGMINRSGDPRTLDGARYAETRLPARLEAYKALGLPPPLTIYADEAVERSLLLPIVADAIPKFA